MKQLYLTLLFVWSFCYIHAQEQMVVRISDPTPADYKYFYTEGYDIAAYLPNIFLDLVVDQKGHDALFGLGFLPKITQTEPQMKANLKDAKTLTGYRTYSDVLTELQQLQANYPAICKLYDLGDSRGKQYYSGGNTNYILYNHDIWALKVSDNVAAEEDEPAIFYFGAHHAREPISTEVTMYVLNHIVSNYGSDPDITASVNNKQIWFVPIVNPDGHRAVIEEVYTMWRKNIRDNNGSGTPEIYNGAPDGVDPNRNYGWEWGGQGTSGSFNSEIYRGPSAFSEPETQAVADLMINHHFVAGITYHSYSELVLYPYGYMNNATAPDNAALQNLAVSMANSIPKISGGGYYTPHASWQLYPAAGVTDDWAYGKHGIFCYTIELATQFIPPASQVPVICQDNLQAAMILLNRVDKSTLTGLVKDASNSQPVVAEVFIEGVDNTGLYREPYKSNPSFGRYYRLLMDGNYTVTVSSYGYFPQTFTNININSFGQTTLNVNLVPSQPVAVSGVVSDLDTGLPVEGALIEIMNTPVLPVSTNASGAYSFSNVMEGTYDFRVSKTGYATIIQSKNVTVSNHVFNFQLEVSNAWSFESGVFEPQWSFSGSAPWYITNIGAYDGTYCSRSGVIGDNASSSMSITLNLSSAGNVSFFRKVSSEPGYDYLKFYIDGVQQGSWAGEVAWGEVSYPVTIGTHTFTWSYIKDANTIGGSDCAWVDYIVFPPLVPLPTPPDILLSPGQFDQVLPIAGYEEKLLNVANTGETALTYSAQVAYNPGEKSIATIYPTNAPFHTGTTTTSSKTQNSLVKGAPPAEAGWIRFDVSSVPDGSTINSVEFHGYVNATSWPYWSITPITQDPLTASPTALYNDIVAEASPGYYLYRSEASNYAPGWKLHMLGGTANTDLQAALLQDWFAIGIMDRDASTYYIHFDGWNESNKPYLVVDYTYNPNQQWLKINGGLQVAGTVNGNSTQDIAVSFDANLLEVGTYTAAIQVTSNDPVQPFSQVVCILEVTDQINLGLSALLEAGMQGSEMSTYLNSAGLIPLTQPFNTSPWNYAGTENVAAIPNNDVADWVLVELRETQGDASTATPATMVSRQAGFILKDGSIVDIDGSSMLRFDVVVNDNLFVIVHHRNHLGIMSSNPVVEAGGNYMHDFTTSSGQAHGGTNAQKQIAPGVWGMIGGDINADGIINLTDKSPEWDVLAGEAGYHQADVNFDGQVNNMDKDDFLLPNQGSSSYIPNELNFK
ncbi:MAG: M14 family zinc carboxypeptidase [Bacteroidales bacterium]